MGNAESAAGTVLSYPSSSPFVWPRLIKGILIRYDTIRYDASFIEVNSGGEEDPEERETKIQIARFL
jgi:hypothetical protein